MPFPNEQLVSGGRSFLRVHLPLCIAANETACDFPEKIPTKLLNLEFANEVDHQIKSIANILSKIQLSEKILVQRVAPFSLNTDSERDLSSGWDGEREEL